MSLSLHGHVLSVFLELLQNFVEMNIKVMYVNPSWLALALV